MNKRLRSQLGFIERLDQLKLVIRMNYLADGSRQENSAEHSWHVAMMAWVCADQADEPVDVGRAVRMLLLHDVVEIEAGDTYVYDVEARKDQEERERQAAAALYGMLPPEQAQECLVLWNEYEARQTPEARYAKAIDSLLPLLQTTANQGGFWREHGITREQVLDAKRNILMWMASPPRRHAAALVDLFTTSDWPLESNRSLINRIGLWDLLTIRGLVRKQNSCLWVEGTRASAPVPGLNSLYHMAAARRNQFHRFVGPKTGSQGYVRP